MEAEIIPTSLMVRKPAALCVRLRAELGPKPGGFRVSPSSLPTVLRGRSPLSARAPLAAEAPCLPVCLWPSGCAVWAAPVVRGNRALLLLCLHPGSPWEQISRAGDSRSHEKPCGRCEPALQYFMNTESAPFAGGGWLSA